MRDRHAAFVRKGVRVYGISLDDAASHRKFREKLALPFPLLVDAGGATAANFRVLKTLGPARYAGRSLFLIGRDGTLRYADPAFGLDDAGWARLFAALAALPDAPAAASAPTGERLPPR